MEPPVGFSALPSSCEGSLLAQIYPPTHVLPRLRDLEIRAHLITQKGKPNQWSKLLP